MIRQVNYTYSYLCTGCRPYKLFCFVSERVCILNNLEQPSTKYKYALIKYSLNLYLLNTITRYIKMVKVIYGKQILYLFRFAKDLLYWCTLKQNGGIRIELRFMSIMVLQTFYMSKL